MVYKLLAQGFNLGKGDKRDNLRKAFMVAQVLIVLSVITFPINFNQMFNFLNAPLPIIQDLSWKGLVAIFAILGFIGKWLNQV